MEAWTYKRPKSPNYSRSMFTELAELAGDVESGRVNSNNIRDEIIQRFNLPSEPEYKPEKFSKHADTQRLHNRKPASELHYLDHFEYNGMVIRVDEVQHTTHPGVGECAIVRMWPDLNCSVEHGNGEPVVLVFYPDEQV